MKKIFLDCGTHLGQGLKEIGDKIGVDHSWSVHSWEANPFTFQQLDHSAFPSNYQFYNKAIGTYNGVAVLNIESTLEGDIGQGTSIVEKQLWMNPMHRGEFNKTVEVECEDLSSWVLSNCCSDDYVVLKLDVEGVEYDVLDKMIKDESIQLIDQLFIEWHARFFPNKEEYWQRQEHLIETLRDNNIDIVRWG